MTTKRFITFTVLVTLTATVFLFSACVFNSTDKPTTETLTVDSTQIKLTIIKQDNQNPGFEYKTNTLFSQTVDLTKEKVDVFFCYRNFHMPYYMPTGHIYKDSIKDKECNRKIYPARVNCYEYDSKDRVLKMSVEGSGTTGSHTFTYDDHDRIIEMTDNGGNKYQMTYDKNGNLIKMTFDGGQLKKTLDFHYNSK